MILLEILGYFIASLIAVPLFWYIGYRLLKSLGYEIVEKNDDTDVHYTNLLDH